MCQGNSASMRIMYTHITSSSDISYDNRITRLSYNERAVPDGRFQHYLFQPVFMQMKVRVFWEVKGSHSCRDHLLLYVRML